MSVEGDELMAKEGQSDPKAPEGPGLGRDFWANATVVFPEEPKEKLTIRLDADLVRWFKTQGRGYQTRINAVLRTYYEAQKEGPD